MKTLVALAAVLLVVSSTFAETAAIAPAHPADVPAAELAPTPPAKVPTKKIEKPKPAKEPVIPGVTLARPNGTFLGFEVAAGGKVKISFYDKKKKPVAPDITKGLGRWKDPRAAGEIRTPLTASGTALISAKLALPPYNYNIYITLLIGEGETAKVVESYTVQYRG